MSEYAVGNKKPPKAHQFKPGVSGNKAGRPKGKIPLAKLIEKHLEAKVVVTVGGMQKKMSRREALIISFVGDALKGKDRVRKQLFDLMLLLEAQAPMEPSPLASSNDDNAVLQSLLHRYGVGKKAKVNPSETQAALQNSVEPEPKESLT